MDGQIRTEQANRQAKLDAANRSLEQAVTDLNYVDPADAQTIANSESDPANDAAAPSSSDTQQPRSC